MTEWGTTEASVKRACKPDSVSRARHGTAAIYLVPPLPKGSCGLPGDDSWALPSDQRRRPPIWPCSGWGLPASRLAPGPGALLPHRFTLACPSRCREAIGAIVSVALSVASLRLGVTQHPALWSPDFPPRRRRSGRPALLTCSVYAPFRHWQGRACGRLTLRAVALRLHSIGTERGVVLPSRRTCRSAHGQPLPAARR